MRFTIEYHRAGHQVASRYHTDSYSAAQKHLLAVTCDEECSDVTYLDRETQETTSA